MTEELSIFARGCRSISIALSTTPSVYKPLPALQRLHRSTAMAGQLVQQAVEQTVLRVAKQLEDKLDDELHKLENIQDDDIERLRQRRIQDLKRQQEKTKEWVAKGHGEYRDLQDEKEFFKEMKGEERMVCHFYRESWPCKVRITSCAAGCCSAASVRPIECQSRPCCQSTASYGWAMSSCQQHLLVARTLYCHPWQCCSAAFRSWTSTWAYSASST